MSWCWTTWQSTPYRRQFITHNLCVCCQLRGAQATISIYPVTMATMQQTLFCNTTWPTKQCACHTVYTHCPQFPDSPNISPLFCVAEVPDILCYYGEVSLTTWVISNFHHLISVHPCMGIYIVLFSGCLCKSKVVNNTTLPQFHLKTKFKMSRAYDWLCYETIRHFKQVAQYYFSCSSLNIACYLS